MTISLPPNYVNHAAQTVKPRRMSEPPREMTEGTQRGMILELFRLVGATGLTDQQIAKCFKYALNPKDIPRLRGELATAGLIRRAYSDHRNRRRWMIASADAEESE